MRSPVAHAGIDRRDSFPEGHQDHISQVAEARAKRVYLDVSLGAAPFVANIGCLTMRDSARSLCARDFFSVPQVGSYYNPDELTELMKSVNSIPAYIERCDYFLVVCPTTEHADMQNVICDYGSWTRRGLPTRARASERACLQYDS